MATPIQLATTGLTTGPMARAFTVGAASAQFGVNSVLEAAVQARSSMQIVTPGREADMSALEGVSLRAPQDFKEFVKLFATPDGNKTIKDYCGEAGPFSALAQMYDEKQLMSQKTRMIHSFWVYSSLMAARNSTQAALARFEAANPGRGEGTILNILGKATHTAWLAGEKEAKGDKEWWAGCNQKVHDFITWGIGAGFIDKPLDVHTNPKKKFKLNDDSFIASTPEDRQLLANRFYEATGAKMFKSAGFAYYINTVAGEWDDLLTIQVPSNPQWAQLRPAFLFGLQADNVASVLFGLEDQPLLDSLAEGSVADKLQSLVEWLRNVNFAWRVNNPWDGINSPLLGAAFALEEDGGIGIGDIVKDAVTLKSTLDELKEALEEGRVILPPAMKAGLEKAFAGGLGEVLDVMVKKKALEAAVRANTDSYRTKK